MPAPNLLFIFTDEQRADTMAAYGNGVIQTPNLNRLAAESVVFDRAYVTQPVCTPSRSTLMTGLWPHTTGLTENNIPLDESIPCLPEMISRGRYVTGYNGKWHLGDEVFAQHGFDEWISIEDMYRVWFREGRDRNARSSYHRFLIESGFRPAKGDAFGRAESAGFPEAFSKPAFQAREACRFLRENKDRPFILCVNFLEPHMPFTGPRNDQHDPASVTLPGNFNDPPTSANHPKYRVFQQRYYAAGFEKRPLKTEADWRRLIANYWGLCSLVDTYTGKILEELDNCGLRDNTIVVYTSDHGDMMGSHRLLAKCVQYEEAIRVPLMIRLPGQRAGRRVGGAISHIDVAPTLLDLMGQPIPDHLQGHSRRDAVEADAPAFCNEDVIVEWNGTNSGISGDKIHEVNLPDPMPDWLAACGSRGQIERAIADPIRTILTPDGWKYNHSAMGCHELYNLNSDPLETKNLARDPQYAPLMKDLRERIRRWQERTGDATRL